jgi:hypothetical protein
VSRQFLGVLFLSFRYLSLQADATNAAIRRVFNNGTIIAVVGNGSTSQGLDNLLGESLPHVRALVFRSKGFCFSLNPGSPRSTGTRTALNSPRGVSSYDASGSFYVSDTNNRVLRRVFRNGTTRIVAGQLGVQGSTDHVAATSGLLDFPRALTITRGGDVVIADSASHLIRVLYANQSLGTLAGTPGISGYSGDGGFGEFSFSLLSHIVSSLPWCFLRAIQDPSALRPPAHVAKRARLNNVYAATADDQDGFIIRYFS